jgi:hypothetical protein
LRTWGTEVAGVLGQQPSKKAVAATAAERRRMCRIIIFFNLFIAKVKVFAQKIRIFAQLIEM